MTTMCICLLFVLLALVSASENDVFRGGRIQWTKSVSNPLAVNFWLQTAWNVNTSHVTPISYTFSFGDGTSTIIVQDPSTTVSFRSDMSGQE